jgi:hypothetical protein
MAAPRRAQSAAPRHSGDTPQLVNRLLRALAESVAGLGTLPLASGRGTGPRERTVGKIRELPPGVTKALFVRTSEPTQTFSCGPLALTSEANVTPRSSR